MGGINESFKKVGKRLFLFDENIKINYMKNTMIISICYQTDKICYKELVNLDEQCSYFKISNNENKIFLIVAVLIILNIIKL